MKQPFSGAVDVSQHLINESATIITTQISNQEWSYQSLSVPVSKFSEVNSTEQVLKLRVHGDTRPSIYFLHLHTLSCVLAEQKCFVFLFHILLSVLISRASFVFLYPQVSRLLNTIYMLMLQRSVLNTVDSSPVNWHGYDSCQHRHLKSMVFSECTVILKVAFTCLRYIPTIQADSYYTTTL